MELLFISLAAFLAVGLTLFSGFGLGTILMPVAVAITAVVHLLNSLFKLGLLWRNVDRRVLFSFGVPALLAAVPGALLLDYLSVLEPILYYGDGYMITPVKLAAGILLIVLATAELVPFLNCLTDHHIWGFPSAAS